MNRIDEQKELVDKAQERATSLDSEKSGRTVTELTAWKTAQIAADVEQRKLSQMQTDDAALQKIESDT